MRSDNRNRILAVEAILHRELLSAFCDIVLAAETAVWHQEPLSSTESSVLAVEAAICHRELLGVLAVEAVIWHRELLSRACNCILAVAKIV